MTDVQLIVWCLIGLVLLLFAIGALDPTDGGRRNG